MDFFPWPYYIGGHDKHVMLKLTFSTNLELFSGKVQAIDKQKLKYFSGLGKRRRKKWENLKLDL